MSSTKYSAKIRVTIPSTFPIFFLRLSKTCSGIYIYTDEIDVTVEVALATMKCAEQYDLPPLAGHCFDSILRDLHASDQNCLRHLEKAITLAFADDSVLENCWHYVDIHCEKILKSEQFSELSFTMLRMMLQRDSLLAEENSIYVAMDRWATAACARSNLVPSATNRRQILGDCLYLIRFPLMTDIQLADGPTDSGLLEPSELKDIYMQKYATTKRSLQFPAQPRQLPIIRVDGVAFKHDEEVFVNYWQYWCPSARVIGLRGDMAVCLEAGGEELVRQSPKHIVRATDYLVAYRPIMYGNAGSYKLAWFVRLENGQHIISLAGTQRRVEFSEIFLDPAYASYWKSATCSDGDDITFPPLFVSTRKRPLDAAGLA
ncbi:BTB/POZ domain-containing protein 3-like isoform X2 [Paramacrobiotus metropolitanus]|uniref:BTB/POZ domain-containing protein 3-like isoform X2 n=1 Tax=Paramacrobiotus metropolitanus TaxID=2943436 RepID=UPI0024460480|nr:BTB/POZ domain-containing protein 3-like isoform X2 [Paramacrobiotus metropolitanus]